LAQPHRVLFLSTNPIGEAPLNTADEERAIKRALEATGAFSLDAVPAARFWDLASGLLGERPAIVHFAGHGTAASTDGEDAALVMRDEAGDRVEVSTETLRRVFALLQGTRCVVLNACFSTEHADALAEHVDFVVATSGALRDVDALAFSRGFYEAVAKHEALETAFGFGQLAISEQAKGDPEAVRLVRRRAPAAVAKVEAAARDRAEIETEGHRGVETVFVGREAELKELAEALLGTGGGRVAIGALQGMPGSGSPISPIGSPSSTARRSPVDM
jgi:hypothetical protein